MRAFLWLGFLLLLALPMQAEDKTVHRYKLIRQWPHGACIGQKCDKNLPEHFTIKGLRATSEQGYEMRKCHGPSLEIEPFNIDLVQDLVEELETQWPSFSGPSVDLWKEQWERYGVCTNFTQHEYFDKTIHLHRIYNLTDALRAQEIYPSKRVHIWANQIDGSIENVFQRLPRLKCTYTHPNYLTEIHMCFEEDLELIDCSWSPGCANEELSMRFSWERTVLAQLKRKRRVKKHLLEYIGLVCGIGLLGWWYLYLWKKNRKMRRLLRTL